jgi:hypothetical protein
MVNRFIELNKRTYQTAVTELISVSGTGLYNLDALYGAFTTRTYRVTSLSLIFQVLLFPFPITEAFVELHGNVNVQPESSDYSRTLPGKWYSSAIGRALHRSLRGLQHHLQRVLSIVLEVSEVECMTLN